MSTLRPHLRALIAGMILLLGQPAPISATPSPNTTPVSTASITAVPIADSVSWHGFVRYWKGFVKNADRVILVVGLIAAAALFIITRGRWLK